MGQYRQTDRYRKSISEYLARPEVRERRRELDRKRSGKRQAAKRAYSRTPRGKVLNCRSSARARLKAATDPQRREELIRLIAAYDAELARMEKRA